MEGYKNARRHQGWLQSCSVTPGHDIVGIICNLCHNNCTWTLTWGKNSYWGKYRVLCSLINSPESTMSGIEKAPSKMPWGSQPLLFITSFQLLLSSCPLWSLTLLQVSAPLPEPCPPVLFPPVAILAPRKDMMNSFPWACLLGIDVAPVLGVSCLEDFPKEREVLTENELAAHWFHTGWLGDGTCMPF